MSVWLRSFQGSPWLRPIQADTYKAKGDNDHQWYRKEKCFKIKSDTYKKTIEYRPPWLQRLYCLLTSCRQTEVLEIGATKISFMKPNSLSQMTDIPMNIDVKSNVWPMIPGKMNCRYSIPAILLRIAYLIQDDKPDNRLKKNWSAESFP